MKSLGFLSADGTPTKRYNDYRNHAISREVMGEALKEAYSDIFLIKSRPTNADKALVEGKFKSFHNTSDNVASIMARTFYALLELADLNFENPKVVSVKEKDTVEIEDEPQKIIKTKSSSSVGLHYNIQIHLPATKDVEVYNAIFKSLKDHLLE